MTATAFFLALACLLSAEVTQPFYDRTHHSEVFGEQRNYRIFLPPAYATSGKRYPVIYYFHGHSDRYTLERYDDGKVTVPAIIRFVKGHDAIVVAVDGYVAEDYGGFYGGSPWDLRKEGGHHDFGPYFKELVAYIDGHYRTLTGRRHRATSGLSMGGFMSLYTSARYPDLIGSASAFNPSPEMFVGDAGRRVLWRIKDHVLNHSHTMVRLVRASGDYISQFHEQERMAYARAHEVDFEYRQDEWHRHAATSIGETFAFHMRAFARSNLDNAPEVFHHANANRTFSVWGYHFEVEGDDPGMLYLESVRQGSLRVRTRRWAPDGPPMREATIRIATAPLYKVGATYRLLDYDISTGKGRSRELTAADDGRLTFEIDGAGHQIGFAGPGCGAQPPLLLPATAKGLPRVPPNRAVALPVSVYNPRGESMKNVRVRVSSEYPTVDVVSAEASIPTIAPGAAVDLSAKLSARFTSGAGGFAPARLLVEIGYDGWHSTRENLDVAIIPDVLPEAAAVEVLDGRTRTFPVFRQNGNSGGGHSIERTVTEGSGNGNGILESGEEATIWVKMVQGMDPFDKNNWYRAKVYSDSPWLTEVADIQEGRQRSWVGFNRTSLVRLSPDTPRDAVIPVVLDNESWSFHFTPDVRYGREPLYQGFQLHRHHLHRFRVGTR